MKLRNKKTGEIVELFGISCKGLRTFLEFHDNRGNFKFECETLAELDREWEDYEDYEEPKGYWYIDWTPNIGVYYTTYNDTDYDRRLKAIGNYFETKEEAEKAVEKLKAWKRLKDKGFRFSKDWVYRYDQPKVENHTYFEFVAICEDGILFDDLDLLFGGDSK